jgi:integrase
MPRIVLTDRFVDGVKSTGKDKDYTDRVARGLALRVFASGRKGWTFRYGKGKRIALGTYPATTLGEARGRALELAQAHAAGEDPRTVVEAAASGSMTVADLVRSYLEKHVRARGLRSAGEIERRFNRNIVPVIGSVRLADLHKRDVNRAVDPILQRGCPTEASHCFADLRALVRWGLRRGDLDRSVVDGMQKPKSAPPRQRVLSDDEIATLWAALPRALQRSPNVQRILKLCLVTGQRVGEIAGLRRDELDLSARLWRLPGPRVKNAHPHQVPLSALALSIIAEALHDAGAGPFLFPCGGRPLPPVVVARTLSRALKPEPGRPLGRLGLAHFTSHDLRRSAISALAALGVTPIVIGHVANHRTITKAGVTFGVYVQHSYAAEKRHALDLWGQRLAAIISGEPAAAVLPLHHSRG